MRSGLSSCRTGLALLVATFMTGSLAAATLPGGMGRGEELTARVDRSIPSKEAIELAKSDLFVQLQALGAPVAELASVLDRLVAAAGEGQVADDVIAEGADLFADAYISDKAEFLMRAFAVDVVTGAVFTNEPSALIDTEQIARRIGRDDQAGAMGAKACGSCATPGGTLPAPTLACQFISGNTCSCSPFSEFWNVTLTAGTTYRFTLCTTTCAGATGSYDSRIRVYAPTCGTALVDNDDSCGLLSQADVVATVTGVHRVEVTGFTASNCGTYTMGYRALPPPPASCGSCPSPVATLTPTTAWQVRSGTLACACASTATNAACGDWYTVNLTGGRTYDFTTCPSIPDPASGGTASFDTRLDIWSTTCSGRIGGNDDIGGCSLIFRSHAVYTPATSGAYRLQVRGFTSDVGTYSVAYRERAACPTAAITNLTPATSSTLSTSCTRLQTFTATLPPGTPAGTVTFAVTAPAGGSAVPTGGSVAYAAGATSVSFSTTLTKPRCAAGNFAVSATVSHCGGTATRTLAHVLSDLTNPTLVGLPLNQTLDCALPVPAPPVVTATDNCDLAPTVSMTQTITIPAGTPAGCANRNINRTWTGRDCNNRTTTATRTISVRDTKGPVLSATPTEACLWPPNHTVQVFTAADLTVSAVDDCSGVKDVIFTGCSSNEPDNGTGDGDCEGDCLVAQGGTAVAIRAERAGTLEDRIYTVRGRARDNCNNPGNEAVVLLVTVPHDDNEHPECINVDGNSGAGL